MHQLLYISQEGSCKKGISHERMLSVNKVQKLEKMQKAAYQRAHEELFDCSSPKVSICQFV